MAIEFGPEEDGHTMSNKPKLSIYWAASCGGCEIAIVNLHEKILAVDAAFDLVFCPCLLDTKKKEIEALPDRSIAITLFNGAIKTEENREMARLMRRKSQLLIAFGACASHGSIPALSNLHSSADLLTAVYLDHPTTPNPARLLPRSEVRVPEGTLHLPPLLDQVTTLAQEVEVDFFIPGCPPEPHQIWKVLDSVIQGQPLPPPGSVLGGGRSAVCEECERRKGQKKITSFHRTYEIIPDPDQCLLEQGIICMGAATRDGCGALCPKVNMPCTGCYGPPDGVLDQGAKMVAALGSILDIGPTAGLSPEEIAERVEEIIGSIPDMAGSFYKYSLAGSLLKGRIS
jgi:F420-non-reducing hydrogenase small subunit